MAAVNPSEPPAPDVMSEPLLRGPPPRPRPLHSQEGPVAVSSLLPVSPCPQLAFDSRIQSVDLFATAPHILEASGRCSWCPCCSGSKGPPFDWIALLHCAASSGVTINPTEASNPSPCTRTSASGSLPPNPQLRTQPQALSEQQRALQIVQSLRDGAVPVGARAELSTLVGHNQLVFGGVKEINAAYRSAWLCIYACMVFAFFFAPLGWVLLFLVTVSSTVRRTLDEYVLYWMSQACNRVNMLLYPCGVALMLLEGSSEDASVSPTAAAALVDIEVAAPSLRMTLPGGKVWVLRIFMLPRARLPHHRHHSEGCPQILPTEATTEGASPQAGAQ